MFRTSSIAFRLVAAATLWIVVALITGGLLLSGSFRAPVENAFDQRLAQYVQSLIAAVQVGNDGSLTPPRSLNDPRFDTPYSGLYWLVRDGASGAVLLRSRSLWDFTPEARADGTVGAIRRFNIAGPEDQRLRVVEQRIAIEGQAGREFLFAVAADRAEIEDSIDRFNTLLAWSLGALGLGLIAAVLLQVRYGLRPLRRISEALADIRAGRSQRLEGNFPYEVRPLADELNGLLDHTSEVLSRARAHVGNLAHALKTPLAVLANEAASPDADFAKTVEAQTALMRHQVDHHLSRARATGQANVLGIRTDVWPVAEAIARTLEKIHADRGISVTAGGEHSLAFRGEQHDLEEMMGNLVDNACKWASQRVRVTVAGSATVGSGGMRLVIDIEDDGPGVPPNQREELFKRGVRLDEATPGTGLGLSIVRDIAALYGGEVRLDDAELGGLKATLVLPGITTAG